MSSPAANDYFAGEGRPERRATSRAECLPLGQVWEIEVIATMPEITADLQSLK
jgi:hypothetical protein